MKTLRITGVPEHFNYPFVLLNEQQPLLTQGVLIQWIEESRGSGQMNLALRNNETEVAILLTESFMKDFEAGNPSKMIGYHVETPLNWGIHIRSASPVDSLKNMAKKHFLVSRMGSGSHLMAFVLARREGWEIEDLSFEIVHNLGGAKEVMDAGNDGLFLWEKYTTAPLVDQGTMKRIGEVPSPWPCFVIVASDKALVEFGDLIVTLRDHIYRISSTFGIRTDRAKILAEHYGLDPADLEKWLEQTRWTTEPSVSKAELNTAIKDMVALGILKSTLDLDAFCISDGLRIEE